MLIQQHILLFFFQYFLYPLFTTIDSIRHCFLYFHNLITVYSEKISHQSEYTYVKVLRKFLPTRLLGLTRLLRLTRLLNVRVFSNLHGYLDSTLIRHLRVSEELLRAYLLKTRPKGFHP